MNNFNQSSTGYNIELDVFFDTDTSRSWFDDCFKLVSSGSFSLLNSRYRNVNIYAYDLSNFELFDLDNWITPTKKALYNLLLSQEFAGYLSDFNDKSLSWFNKYSYHLTVNELLEVLSDCDEKENIIIENFEPKFTVVSSRGHCQGDYVEVIYFKEDYNNNETLDFKNEIWNSPLYARFTVNDTEFYIDENLKDPYSYDVDEFVSVITKLIGNSGIKDKQTVIEELTELLPVNYPDYK